MPRFIDKLVRRRKEPETLLKQPPQTVSRFLTGDIDDNLGLVLEWTALGVAGPSYDRFPLQNVRQRGLNPRGQRYDVLRRFFAQAC